jgi:uncharacterized protein YbjT (DUF2867 family)
MGNQRYKERISIIKEKNMNILLTGATGFIGNHLLRALLQQGHSVTACCRNPKRLLIQSDHLTLLPIDFTTADNSAQWLPHLNGIDAVINCVGIIAETQNQTFAQLHKLAPIALFTAAEQAGVKKIIQISALGADAQAESAYHLTKRAADEVLRGLVLDWFILQPSVVYGDGAQSSALFHALAALPVHVLPDGGQQQLQPIHVDDLVAVVAACLKPVTLVQQTFALVGATPYRYADLLQNLRRRLGKSPAPTISLPQRYVLMTASLGKWLGEPILSKDNMAMLNRGNTADPSGIAQLLGRLPVSMKQSLFEKPATQAERWHAQLYFLKPLLWLAIVLVWLWSGITSLFFYPHQLSYQLLAGLDITGNAAMLTLYGLALMDIGLGLATLCRYRLNQLLLWQFWIVLGYSLVVAVMLPEFWLHPFGPLLKNIPFLLTLLVYRVLEGERP